MSWRRASAPVSTASPAQAIERILAGRKRDIGGFSVERLLPAARAAGYAGSDRNFRRLVAEAKRAWRHDRARAGGRRPAIWSPGEVLAIDWGEGPVQIVSVSGGTFSVTHPYLDDNPSGPAFEKAPFTSLYLLDDEWAAEVVNRTVHGVMHIGWVPDETGGYRGEMAVYVKPNGLLGNAYMAAIRPFRHLIVYPPLMRRIEKEWRASAGDRTPEHA